jgi:hypothetical protein
MENVPFLRAVEIALKSIGTNANNSPATLIDQWSRFVDTCTVGYTWNIYEFKNELTVRDVIESILGSDRLKEYPEYNLFKEEINKVDSRFKDLLFPIPGNYNSGFWWRNGILKKSGKEYSEDIKSLYNITVEVI